MIKPRFPLLLFLQSIVGSMLQSTYQLIRADRVSIFIVNRDSHCLNLALSEDAHGKSIPITKGIAGAVTLTGQV